jgi:hypothetical protein
MHKRRASPAAAEFLTTCLIWGLVLVVLLQLATHRPQTDSTVASTAALQKETAAATAAAAAAAAAALPAEAAVSKTDKGPTGTTKEPDEVISTKSRNSGTNELLLRPESYTDASLVVVTTATAPYVDWTLNWSHFLKKLNVNHAVVALDYDTVSALATHGMPAVLDASKEAQQLGLMTHKSVRREYEHLRALVSVMCEQCLQPVCLSVC